MNPSTLRTAIAGLATGLVLVAVLFSYQMQAASRRAAEDEAAALAECRKLATQIRALRDQPRLAGSREQPLKELAALVEQSREAAAIPPEALVRIEPAAPRRLGKTAYLEQEISLELSALSLVQFAQFLEAASGPATGLRVKRLQLIEPRRGSEETWGAEVVLAYLIYSPPSAAAAAKPR